jgi:hypothetical protein
MEASFRGLIGRVEVPDLLTFVHLGRRTGVTELERKSQSTRIFFRGGDPIFATSDREGLRIGDVLVRAGKATRKDVERALARQRSAVGHRLGQAFVSAGLLKDEELSACLKVQVSDVIFDTFGWSDGSFAFYDDVAPPPDAVTLEMDIQNLLMEGVRRMDERGRLAEVFPDKDAVLETLANADRLRDNVTLIPEEWQVLFVIDGRRSVGEICQIAGNPDELATLEVLNRLLAGNLIGFASPRASSPDPRQVTAPAGTMLKRAEEAKAAAARKAEAGPRNEPVGQTSPPLPASEANAIDTPETTRPRRVEAGSSSSGIRDLGDASVVVNREAVQYTARTMALWARLDILSEDQALSFALTRDTHSLGRSEKNDIVVLDRAVSTFHARIDRTEAGFKIIDLQSTNGIVVNGAKTPAAVLKPGDEIEIGPVRMRYSED